MAVTTVGALVLTLLGGTASAVGVPTQAAQAQAAGVSDVRVGLIHLGRALAAAAEQPALSEDLPLTDLSVRNVLRLDSAIGAEVEETLEEHPSTTLDTLPDAFPAGGPLVIEEVTPSTGAPADSREWTLTVNLKAAVPVALTYQDDRLQFGTAQLDGELAGRLRGELRFRYDPSQVGLRTFAVVGTSNLTTHVWTRATGASDQDGTAVDVPAFTAVDGFVQLGVQGTATIDSSTELALRDPNGRGLITTEDFEFSSADELFTTLTGPGPDDVSMDLDLGSDLDDTAAGSITVGTRADATTSYAKPTIARNDALDRLTALTRVQAVTGFTQYTSAVVAAEASADQEFPLLDLSLSDLYSPGQQLTDLLTEQATATIMCGAADTSPPSGAPRPGQVRYCQALSTAFEPSDTPDISWESPDPDVHVVAHDDGAGTIGREPSANVAVTGGDGFPVLRVTFTGDDGVVHHARSTVASIQDLSQAVSDLKLDGALSYDRGSRALEVAVRQTGGAAKTTEVATGGNGNLAPLTGLTGLCQAAVGVVPRTCPQTGDKLGGSYPAPAAGQAEVTTSDRAFHADFGIGMVPPAAAPADGAEAPAEPVFYVRPDADGQVYRVGSVDAELDDDAKLVARIGFLQVDVDVTSYSLDQTGDVAASVSVDGSAGVTLPSGGTVSNSVAVTDLLTEDPDAAVLPQATRGLEATADLKVSGSQQGTPGALTRPIDAEGTVHAAWSHLLPQTLPHVTTGGRYDELRLLDLVPSRQASMRAGTANGTIVDPTADFLKQFGVAASDSEVDRTVTRQLYDLSVAGSSSTVCTAFVVLDAHTLRCDQGPLSEPGVVSDGDDYVINGDPEALRNVLVEDLAGVLTTFSSPDPALDADRTFPLVDLKPTEISAARDGFGATVAELQSRVSSEDPADTFSISTMQQLSTTLDGLLGDAVGGDAHATSRSVKFTLVHSAGLDRLVLDTSLAASGTKDVPLRVAVDTSELRVIGSGTAAAPKVATIPLNVGSTARVVVGVDLADATSSVGGDTAVTEQVTGLNGSPTAIGQTLSGKPTEYGSARVTTGAAGNIKLGIGVGAATRPDIAAAAWLPLDQLPTKLTQARSVVGSPQTCGAPEPADAASIAACLELPLNDATDVPLTPVKVALKAGQSSGGAGGAAAPQPIAYRFLTDGLGALNLTLADALDGDQSLDTAGAPMSLPLVGTNLDAGADVPADVTEYVSAARARLALVETSVAETADASRLQTDLQTALNEVTVANVTHPDVVVTLGCGAAGTATCDDKTVADVQRISVPLTLSGSLGPEQVPFQVGPAGASIKTNLKVPTKTTWTLAVTVGIGRGTGPFVKLDPDPQAQVVLTVHVTSHLAAYNATSNKCHSWSRHTNWKEKLPASRDIVNVDVRDGTDVECVDAFVGKLPSVLVDRIVEGSSSAETLAQSRSTALDATIEVGVAPLPSAGPEGLTYLPALYDKAVAFTTKATGSGRISVYFESFASQSSFFDVLGTIDLAWSNGAYTGDGLRFGLLNVDVTTLNNAILPGFDKAKKWLAPLNPVVDTLSKPIPVVTDMSELVGKGPVTMLTLLQKQKTPINLVLNLLQLQNMIAGGPSTGPDLQVIGTGLLGGFTVAPSRIGVGTKCTETVDKNGTKSERTTDGSGASGKCKPGAITKLKQALTDKIPPKDEKGTKIDKTSTKSPYLSLPSVSVPVLQDTSQIFNLLLDEGDATMLYVDLGHAGVTAQVVRNFGPFFIGPVPVTASIGGTVGLDGRFAFGFDTRGLSRKIEALDPGDIAGFDALGEVKLFSDGFYIDDLENGVDVPEIQLSFTVQAGAAVSIGFAEAGIRGGVVLDLSLDAFDPNGDGKIYSDEFAGAANGPECAFNVSSGLTFFLQFYFSIDLLFYTINESFDIVRSPRIKLFEFNCKIEDPVLAVYTDPAAGHPQLRLTMGPDAAGSRKGYTDVFEEKYTVRQLGRPTPDPHPDLITLQVSAFNLVQNFEVKPNTVIVGRRRQRC